MKKNITNKKLYKFIAIHEHCKDKQKTAMDVNLELDENCSFRATSGTMLEMSKIGLLERIEITKSKICYKSIDCDVMKIMNLNYHIYDNSGKVPQRKHNNGIKWGGTKASNQDIKNASGQVIGQIRTIAEKHSTRNRFKTEWRGIGSSFNIV